MGELKPTHFFKKIFFNSNSTTHTVEVGDKIITQTHPDLICIKENKRYLANWGIKFIGIAILLFLFFIFRSSYKVNFYTIAMMTAPTLLFLIIGISYLKRAKEKVFWIIDLDKKLFFIHQYDGIPFEEIIQFSIGEVKYGVSSKRISYYLNLQTKKNSELTLFKSDSYAEIQNAAAFLSVKCR